MITKYKVNEVAKDFGLQNKDITETLAKFFDEPKKSQTALDTKELDVLFDVLTQENSVSDFNAYFAMQKKEEKAPKKEAKKEPKKAENKETQKKAPQKKEEAKAEPQKKSEKPTDSNKTKNEKANNKKADNKKAEEKKPEAKKHGESSLNPFKKHEKKNDGPMQSRTKGERRTIDTRAEDIQLDKYNEKYENIAPANSMRDNYSRKQKIKQKQTSMKRQKRKVFHYKGGIKNGIFKL